MFNSKQLLFIDAYLKDSDHIEAYRKAFKVKDKQIARVAGLRLLKSPKIALIISEKQAIQNKIIADATEQSLIKATKQGLRDVIEIDLKIQEIIFKPHQLIRDGNKVIKVENTTSDQLKAAELFYKRHGHFAPTTSNVAVVTAIKIIRE